MAIRIFFLAMVCAMASYISPALAQSSPIYANLPIVCPVGGGGGCQQATPIANFDGTPIGTPVKASSTPCSVSATSSAITPTGCTGTGSSGTYVAGPFNPQAGYPVRIVTSGTWSGSIAVGTSSDNCTTVNPLTVAGQTYGSFTGNANEAVDVPATTGSIAYCMSITVSSGTLSAALRQ